MNYLCRDWIFHWWSHFMWKRKILIYNRIENICIEKFFLHIFQRYILYIIWPKIFNSIFIYIRNYFFENIYETIYDWFSIFSPRQHQWSVGMAHCDWWSSMRQPLRTRCRRLSSAPANWPIPSITRGVQTFTRASRPLEVVCCVCVAFHLTHLEFKLKFIFLLINLSQYLSVMI
jgi:hypothetical protein